jgi:hypothetical protein
MQDTRLTRRECLRLAVLGAGALGLANQLTGCNRSEPAKTISCDASELSDADKATRTAMQYIDSSPHADKTCANCNLYQAPPQPNACGGCTIIKGPIHPQGWCLSWVAKAGTS